MIQFHGLQTTLYIQQTLLILVSKIIYSNYIYSNIYTNSTIYIANTQFLKNSKHLQYANNIIHIANNNLQQLFVYNFINNIINIIQYNENESILTVSKSHSTMYVHYFTCRLLIALSYSETGFLSKGPIKNESAISVMYKPQQKNNYIKGICVQMFTSQAVIRQKSFNIFTGHVF